MKAPKDQYVIQIDVTNACVHTCSNCTRFCGHHKKPFFMEFDTFCKAVDCTIDHPGMIGVMGGEPTLHPQFADMCLYLQAKIAPERKVQADILRYPTDRLVETRRRLELEEYEIEEYADAPRAVIKGVGLWTSLTKAYLKNYELIQDTFNYQNLNDHRNASYHQPILISRKEMGIGDEEWIKLREKCWVNHEWSGSITPKGCFFCEVAASFDMLYDGPGGLPITKGWWKRDILDYKEQFHWCEMCGIPLQTFSRDAREEIDDISPFHYRKFQESSRIEIEKKGLNVLEINNGKITETSIRAVEKYRGQTYIDDAQQRIAETTPLYAGEFYGIMTDDGSISLEDMKVVMMKNSDYFEKMAVLTNRKEAVSQLVNIESVEIVSYRDADVANAQKSNEGTGEAVSEYVDFWARIKTVMENFGKGKYIVLFTPEIIFASGMEKLKKCVINPGTLHYIDFTEEIRERENDYIVDAEQKNTGIVMLFNSYASSFEKLNSYEDSLFNTMRRIKEQWEETKVVEFSNDMNRGLYDSISIRKSIKSGRVKNTFAIWKKFNRKYGVGKTLGYGVAIVKHYGIKLTVSKFRSRIY